MLRCNFGEVCVDGEYTLSTGEYTLSIDVCVDGRGEYMLSIESSGLAHVFAGDSEEGEQGKAFTDLVARD